MEHQYPHGDDLEWFATDAKGQIARFTTGGLGPIPVAVVAHGDLCDAARHEARKLPPRGNAQTFVAYPKLRDFIRCSEAGIYTYDCDDLCSGGNSRSYQLVSSPSSPLLVSDTQDALRDALRLLVLRDVEFGKTAQIGAEHFGQVVTSQ